MSDALFWSKVDKTGDCWPYTGATNPCGYGWVSRLGTQLHAHRFGWIDLFGPIHDGMSVLHTCDNRRCVNPDHLYLGTQQQNMLDRRNRARVKAQKLTMELVTQMRAEFKAGATKSSLARGLQTQQWIRQRGDRWKSLEVIRQGRITQRR